MIKRTLFFSNPAYLSTTNNQLCVRFPDSEQNPQKSIPIEDLGYVVLEHPQITLTNGLLNKLLDNKTAVVTCNAQHLPYGFLQPMVGHTEQTERYRHQLNSSVPLKKQLWQQTVVKKIRNQAMHLKMQRKDSQKLIDWSYEVKSGDADNHEAFSAAYYFQNIFDIKGFSRNADRGAEEGKPPNNLLNYGYAILRAIAARALVCSGLLPSVGIHHQNKYNPFCLADDIMEPYRPMVDILVCDIMDSGRDFKTLDIEMKTSLLKIPAMDVKIDGKKSPLMSAMSRTSNSLYECFCGVKRTVLYPDII